MNLSILSSIIITGFTVAFFHAIIPTHWLPFVIGSRTQKWSRLKTMTVVIIAGTGHVLVTSALGIIVVFAGLTLDEKVGTSFSALAGGALLLLGGFNLYRYFKGTGHEHGHIHLLGEHHHHESVLCFKGEHGGVLIDTTNQLIEVSVHQTGEDPRLRLYFYNETAEEKKSPDAQSVSLKLIRNIPCEDGTAFSEEIFLFNKKDNCLETQKTWPELKEFEAQLIVQHKDHSHEYMLKYNSDQETNEVSISSKKKTRSDRMAILSLLTLLTFSPCESFLPVYLSGVQYGWSGFVILSLVLAVATLLAMMLFTWLALTGIEKLKLHWIEKHETAIMGTALFILGLIVMFLEE